MGSYQHPIDPGITREALAAFVEFVRLNPRLPSDAPYMARAFAAYRDHGGLDAR
jgi:hypothetical protein